MREFVIDGEIDPTISYTVQFWLQVLAMKSPMGEQKYLHMATLSLQLLSIPASNIDSERVFSGVRRIKTEFCSSLSTESVSALISCHFNNTSKCCENKHFDEHLIAKAKTCARERNLRYIHIFQDIYINGFCIILCLSIHALLSLILFLRTVFFTHPLLAHTCTVQFHIALVNKIPF